MAEAQEDDEIRVIALTGNGDAFCSGLDLGAGDDEDPPDTGLSEQEHVLDEKGWVGRFLLALRFETDKPVVVGLNGVAVGAGLSLAMAADIRIAADTARLHPGYLRAGASPDGGLTWSLPTLVGHETGPPLPARVPVRRRGGGAPPRVRLRGRPGRPSSTAGSWRSARPSPPRRPSRCGGRSALVARTPLVTDVDARVIDEIRKAVAGLDSEDGQEAVQAMIEKRTPTFRGPMT